MDNKIARLKYLDNSFEILEMVLILYVQYRKANSIRKVKLLNVELQEPYFSYIEANQKRDKFK